MYVQLLLPSVPARSLSAAVNGHASQPPSESRKSSPTISPCSVWARWVLSQIKPQAPLSDAAVLGALAISHTAHPASRPTLGTWSHSHSRLPVTAAGQSRDCCAVSRYWKCPGAI